MSKRKADEMTKPEHNACLSTSNPDSPNSSPTPSPGPSRKISLMEGKGKKQTQEQTPRLSRRRHEQHSQDGNDSPNGTHKATRPDYLLVLCLILIYLELSWLILMLLRTYSRH